MKSNLRTLIESFSPNQRERVFVFTGKLPENIDECYEILKKNKKNEQIAKTLLNMLRLVEIVGFAGLLDMLNE